MNIKVHTFEGPLDLLLHLIDQAEVDIYDISVAEITDQYMAYIHKMQQLELEIASEFLVMAAKLIAMKSRMLLPQQEEEWDPLMDEEMDEVDPREELIQRLIEYRKYKGVAEQLREKEVARSQVYTRPAESITQMEHQDENPVANVSLFDLLDAFESVLEDKAASTISKIDREEISIDERMSEIMTLIEYRTSVSFRQLFEAKWNKNYLIVTFLSLLELMKKKMVICHQDALFSDIMISLYSEAK
ncbi:segregation and condensation protein A [Caldalkalibacillus salinus]|uniref:segregation and condensation protein A n=1 Tax=Caldalkalibacillus salinus TaxID=2803787 RepID=UPI0019228F45|nr:segregation/condensation protein A [Caldalkalibacillus salinus]